MAAFRYLIDLLCCPYERTIRLMTLHPRLRDRLRLPAICAPMFLVSGPDLVREARIAGLMAGLPRHNARTTADFESWLAAIQESVAAHLEAEPGAVVGPLAVNLSTRLEPTDMDCELALCRKYGVDVIISAAGDPTALTAAVHHHGLVIFHDATSLRFAEKAISAGVDGITCIGVGGGGKSGTTSHLVLVPKIRSMFDGTIVLAGAVSTGAAIRAAEVLGADLAYIGTRFIASQESLADPAYKQMIVAGSSADLVWTPDVVGVPGSWLAPSLAAVGLDPAHLPPAEGADSRHLPAPAKPWKNVWSAGQGVDLIHDAPPVGEIVDRLEAEYREACRVPEWSRPRHAAATGR